MGFYGHKTYIEIAMKQVDLQRPEHVGDAGQSPASAGA
jgi:hypothetical protein